MSTKAQTTFWVSFADPDAQRSKQFLGVAIIGMDEDASVIEIVRRTWDLGINPGSAVAIAVLDAESAASIPNQHGNKLITP